MAIRVIRGYRTISFEAASLLAGTPPWDLEAEALSRLYWWRKEAQERGLDPEPRVIEAIHAQLRRDTVVEWKDRLGQPSAGHAVVAAVRPVMEDWLERPHGGLSYRLTQVISGKGCFGDHLCLIRKEPTPECHHCDADEDSGLHTLAECPAWEVPRQALLAALGVGVLTLPVLIAAMVQSADAWSAAASFCEQVMLEKEAAERVRERLHRALPNGGGRGRLRRRRSNDLRPP